MLRTDRVGLVHLSLLVFAVALVGRAAQVQLLEHRTWVAKARHEHFAPSPTMPPRGPILDVTGSVVAASREVVHFSVAPAQVKDPAALARALTTAGVPPNWVSRATDRREAWVVIPGRYPTADAGDAMAIAGVHTDASVDREPLGSDGMRRLVGRVGNGGAGADGLELSLDSVLRGDAGPQAYAQDASGVRFEPPGTPLRAASTGNTVVLTVNHALQEICDQALADAVTQLGASGGDIVVVDPHDGSVLAMASNRRDPKSIVATALTEPFEPGSTVKPFIAAALLSLGRARPGDVVDTHNGVWVLNGRRIEDEHKLPSMSLREVIKYSSNIGITQFVGRLTPGEEYQALRDAGFGMPSGVPYPEAGGRLRPPIEWSPDSRASLAFGYELSVTPLQLAMAYASIANGGELLEPALIHEVRRPDGTVLYAQRRRVVRRVMPVAVADTVRAMLSGVVEGGTGMEANLSTFDVAGKTGTAYRTIHGHYVPDAFTASFVGLFPARAPRYVIVVKLDNPHGEHFGGKAAAPVSKVVLQAAIAAEGAAFDRTVLAARSQSQRGAVPETAAADVAPAAPESTVTVGLPLTLMPPEPAGPPRAVPSVAGLPLRVAVHTLHRAGFRVVLEDGPVGRTVPAAGTMTSPGTLVRLAGAP
jgi:cell division protein FtsI (penicillin-binding protein 3)